MFCKNCGNDLGNRPEVMFCPKCGAAVERDKEVSGKNSKTPKSKKASVIIALCMAVLIIGGGYVATHANCKVVVKNGECYVREGILQKRENMKTANIPDGVTSIGANAFSGCSSLNSVKLPEGLIRVEDRAFYGCRSLEIVTLPESVEYLGNGAFEQSGLKELNLPIIVDKYGENVFLGSPYGNNIVNIKPLSLEDSPEDTTDSGYERYGEYEGICYGVKDHFAMVCEANEDITEAEIPSIICIENDLYNVSGIDVGAFIACGDSLVSIKLSKGLTSIGPFAFYGCSSLSSVSLPEGLTSIGERAFESCVSLYSISLPENLSSIGVYAFLGCSNLSSVNLPEGLTSISPYAFARCSSLSSVSLPESLKFIGNEIFSECDNLRNLQLPSSLEHLSPISLNVFSEEDITRTKDGCVYVDGYLIKGGDTANITIEPGTKLIADEAFWGCSNLISINLPEGLGSIGYSAFSGCSSLSSVSLPESLSSIETSAFDSCPNLKDLQLPSKLEYLGSISPDVFLEKDITRTKDGCIYVDSYLIKGGDIANIIIEPGTKLIAGDAFDECSNLIRVSLPEGLTSIGDSAFAYCYNLNSINLPESLTSIGAGAFSQCSSLINLNLPEGLTSLGRFGTSVFQECTDFKEISMSAKQRELFEHTLPRGCKIILK